MASNNLASMRLTVVYVNFNATDYLLRSLSSLRDELSSCADLLSGFDVTVVDNGSARGSLRALQRLGEVKVVTLDRNVGFAAANNLAFKMFPADLYLLLNPDIVLLPGCLRSLLDLARREGVAVSAPLLLNPDGSLQSAGYRFPTLVTSLIEAFPVSGRIYNSRLNGRARIARAPYEVDYVLGAVMLVNRRAVDHVGLMDEGYFMYSEEVDWCHRFRICGWKVMVHPKSAAIHFGGASTGQRPQEMWYYLQRSRYLYYSKYYPGGFVEGHRWITRIGTLRLALATWLRWKRGIVNMEERDRLWRLYGQVFRL